MKNRNLFTSAVTKTQITESKDFAEALDLLLRYKHWKLKDLAAAMGYSQKHISCITHNKADMTIKFAKRLEKVSDITCLFWIELYLDKFDND